MYKSVMSDENKLLNSQIDRLMEAMDIMSIRPQGTQVQQNRPYNPYIHRSRGGGHRNYPSYGRG